MQLDFTYQLADLREAAVPERYAANPERYGRRWIWRIPLFALAALMAGFSLWIQAMLPIAAVPQPAAVAAHDLRTELLPALIPGFYVCTMYLLAIWKTWRFSHDPNRATAGSTGWAVHAVRLSIGVICGVGLSKMISHDWDSIWYPTTRQLIWTAAGPWVLVIVLMQILGVLQRRGPVQTRWRGEPGLRRPQTVILDDAGFHISDSLCSANVAWSCFKRARETKNLLILSAEGTSQILLPKRAFASAEDIVRCRSMLQNLIPTTRFLVPPIGFAVLPTSVLPLPEPSPVLPNSASS